jgi:type I restriction enzyme S subunit
MELGSEIKSNKYMVIANSILISKLNPRFPRVWAIRNLLDYNSICSTEFQVVLPLKPEYFSFIYCFLKSKPVTDELVGAAGGTSGSHQRVKPEDIFNLTFQMPPRQKIEAFDLIISENWKKVENNLHQIRTLEKLRDTLLPKLMSGEVRVEYEH